MFYLTSDASEKYVSFEKKVSSFLLKLHFKRPVNFLRSFYQKPVGFSVYFGFSGKIYWTPGGNISIVVKNAIWAKIFRPLAKLFNRIVKKAFYVSRGTLWRKHCWLLEINSTFGRKFFGFAENFFRFFRWVILQMVVKTAFFMPRRTYAMRKTFWQNFFLSFSDYEGYFLKLPLRYLMLGCQKYSLRV